MNYKLYVLTFLLSFSITIGNAQEDNSVDSTEFDIFGDTEDGFSLIDDMPLTLNMEREMELSEEAKDAQKRKDKRRKKKWFYGLKTKKKN